VIASSSTTERLLEEQGHAIVGEAVVGELSFHPELHEPEPAQELQLLRRRRHRPPGDVRQIADAQLGPSKGVQDAQPRGIPEGAEPVGDGLQGGRVRRSRAGARDLGVVHANDAALALVPGNGAT
jgi:hypothetical protein